jgi:hypothetical protein
MSDPIFSYVQPQTEDIHAFLEKTLIETYRKGKGHKLDELQDLPEMESRQLMKEASTYVSTRLAEVELKAHLVQDLHGSQGG